MACCGVLLAFFDGFVDVVGLSVELGGFGFGVCRVRYLVRLSLFFP